MSDEARIEQLAKVLARHPSVSQVMGCANGETGGLYVLINGGGLVVTAQPVREGESFTFSELPALGRKGRADKG